MVKLEVCMLRRECSNRQFLCHLDLGEGDHVWHLGFVGNILKCKMDPLQFPGRHFQISKARDAAVGGFNLWGIRSSQGKVAEEASVPSEGAIRSGIGAFSLEPATFQGDIGKQLDSEATGVDHTRVHGHIQRRKPKRGSEVSQGAKMSRHTGCLSATSRLETHNNLDRNHDDLIPSSVSSLCCKRLDKSCVCNSRTSLRHREPTTRVSNSMSIRSKSLQELKQYYRDIPSHYKWSSSDAAFLGLGDLVDIEPTATHADSTIPLLEHLFTLFGSHLRLEDHTVLLVDGLELAELLPDVDSEAGGNRSS